MNGAKGEYIMRPIVEIQEDIEALVDERMAYEVGSVEYESYDSDITHLEKELDEAWELGKQAYIIRLQDIYHRQELV